MFKVIIAGGREFKDYKKVEQVCDKLLANKQYVEIVSGGATGADACGEKYAMNGSLPCKIFKADWINKGKSAGYIRNKQMAEYADALIAFWDGKSPGTKMMIELAKQYKLLVRVIKY